MLAKNLGGALPLAPASTFTSALVIGPLLDLTGPIRYYGSYPCNGSFVTPLQAVQQHIPTAIGIPGVLNVTTRDTSGVAAAAAAAAGADLVILTIGSDMSLEMEGLDRTVIDFSPAQVALVTAGGAAAQGPGLSPGFSGGALGGSLLPGKPPGGAAQRTPAPAVGVGRG